MLIGHSKNINYLEHILNTNALVGSYLFYGREHLGKTTVAEWFIKKILKTESLGNHPDFSRCLPPADEKTNKKTAISVEILREAVSKLHNTPLVADYNVLLIEEAEYINESGWNLLLKTLEEPSLSAIIILVAHSIEGIPKTVLSRVQKIHFLSVPEVDLLAGLRDAGYTGGAVDALLPIALGRPGIVIEALTLGSLSKEIGTDELLAALEQSFAHRTALFEKSSKEELAVELDRLLLVCRDAVFLKNDCADHLVFPKLKEKISRLGDRLGDEDLYLLIKKVLNAKESLSRNANPRLVMEDVLFQI